MDSTKVKTIFAGLLGKFKTVVAYLRVKLADLRAKCKGCK